MSLNIEKKYFEEIYGEPRDYFGDDFENISDAVSAEYAALVETLKGRGATLSSAESFTGGLIGKLLTDVSGSSAVFNGGVIAYVNEIKEGLLGVKRETIEKYTEVSFSAAAEMAVGARRAFKSDIAVATTGFAGPTGGNESDPVGTVYVAVATTDKVTVFRIVYAEELLVRDTVRTLSALFAAREVENLFKFTK